MCLERMGSVGGEQREEVCELAEGAGESVVGCVVRGAGDGVAAQDGGGAMRGVGFVGCEVDFAEESVGDGLVLFFWQRDQS